MSVICMHIYTNLQITQIDRQIDRQRGRWMDFQADANLPLRLSRFIGSNLRGSEWKTEEQQESGSIHRLEWVVNIAVLKKKDSLNDLLSLQGNYCIRTVLLIDLFLFILTLSQLPNGLSEILENFGQFGHLSVDTHQPSLPIKPHLPVRKHEG